MVIEDSEIFRFFRWKSVLVRFVDFERCSEGCMYLYGMIIMCVEVCMSSIFY